MHVAFMKFCFFWRLHVKYVSYNPYKVLFRCFKSKKYYFETKKLHYLILNIVVEFINHFLYILFNILFEITSEILKLFSLNIHKLCLKVSCIYFYLYFKGNFRNTEDGVKIFLIIFDEYASF